MFLFILAHGVSQYEQFSKVDIKYYFFNQVSRLSTRSSPFARKSRCLHTSICLLNDVRILSNNY